MLWNALAAFALLGPRDEGEPIAPALSWLSGVALILLAFSASFASIDWMLSLLADLLVVDFSDDRRGRLVQHRNGDCRVDRRCRRPALAPKRRSHIADLAQILLATTIFWSYVEFMQFLIIWEEDLKSEIDWYLRRSSDWLPAFVCRDSAGLFCAFPGPAVASGKAQPRRWSGNRLFADAGGRMPPENGGWCCRCSTNPAPFWLDVAAIVALGALMLLLFSVALRSGPIRLHEMAMWKARHG